MEQSRNTGRAASTSNSLTGASGPTSPASSTGASTSPSSLNPAFRVIQFG